MSKHAKLADKIYLVNGADPIRHIGQSEVLRILKSRIYFGQGHDTTLDDLKIASAEILDWVDSVLAVAGPSQSTLESKRDKEI